MVENPTMLAWAIKKSKYDDIYIQTEVQQEYVQRHKNKFYDNKINFDNIKTLNCFLLFIFHISEVHRTFVR